MVMLVVEGVEARRLGVWSGHLEGQLRAALARPRERVERAQLDLAVVDVLEAVHRVPGWGGWQQERRCIVRGVEKGAACRRVEAC